MDASEQPGAHASASPNANANANAIRIQISNPALLLVPVCASTFGFVSGLLSASQKSSLQFLAENAHRQPTTLQGWYFYNKTKNYRVALAGVRGGLATAARLGGWTAGFVAVQETASRSLKVGETQAGALSGVSMAGAASAIYKLPRRTLLKRTMFGLGVGALAGGLQDLRGWVAEQRKKEADGP